MRDQHQSEVEIHITAGLEPSDGREVDFEAFADELDHVFSVAGDFVGFDESVNPPWVEATFVVVGLPLGQVVAMSRRALDDLQSQYEVVVDVRMASDHPEEGPPSVEIR